MTICIFMQMPFIFLFAGLAFPFVIGVADICSGGANIGLQYITSHPEVCDRTLSGTGTLTACSVDKKLMSTRVQFDVDLTAVSVELCVA